MRLLVLQDHLRSGGTERQSILLANAFAAAGHATTLLTFRPGGALAGTVSPAVARSSLQSRDFGLDWFAPGLRRQVRARQPDLILLMGRMANCLGWSLTPLAPVVATMRTGKPLPAWFRRTLRASRHVVANSREVRDHLVGQHGLAAEKIAVIPNSLVFPPEANAAEADAHRAAWRARLGTPPEARVLVCVAMFRPEKNQQELIEIARGLPAAPPWELWLAGEGPALEACRRRAEAAGLGDRVRFPGFLADPSPLYAAADAAVHASRSEALSNFLIEAQAHGLPVVAAAAQGIGECFLPGETGWVIPRGDHGAFRERVRDCLAASPEVRAGRARAARAFARENFSPARQVAAYLELFTRLLPSPGT
jgi:glycosyltransferase involved in cell wall biosynthesis